MPHVTTLDRFLATTLLLVCLFPYFTPVRTPFDTQPYAVCLSIIALLHFAISRRNFSVPIALLPLAATSFVAFAIFLTSGPDLGSLRPLVGYVSAFTIALASYNGFSLLKVRYFIGAVAIWLIVGLVQNFVNREFGEAVLSRMSTTTDRGITSLAVEPSFYAVMCIFFFLLNDIFAARGDLDKKRYIVVFLLICTQLVLASSALGFVLFAIYFAIRMISANRLNMLLRVLIVIIFAGALLAFLRASAASLSRTRLGRLTELAIGGPADFISSDASVSDRMFAVLTSHVSLFTSHGLGYGLNSWSEMAPVISHSHLFIQRLTGGRASVGDQIMSGWGAGLFQLGLVGLLPLISLVALAIRARRVSRRDMGAVVVGSAVTLYAVMLMAVPFAFPMFGFTMGVFASLGNSSQFSELLGGDGVINASGRKPPYPRTTSHSAGVKVTSNSK